MSRSVFRPLGQGDINFCSSWQNLRRGTTTQQNSSSWEIINRNPVGLTYDDDGVNTCQKTVFKFAEEINLQNGIFHLGNQRIPSLTPFSRNMEWSFDAIISGQCNVYSILRLRAVLNDYDTALTYANHTTELTIGDTIFEGAFCHLNYDPGDYTAAGAHIWRTYLTTGSDTAGQEYNIIFEQDLDVWGIIADVKIYHDHPAGIFDVAAASLAFSNSGHDSLDPKLILL